MAVPSITVSYQSSMPPIMRTSPAAVPAGGHRWTGEVVPLNLWGMRAWRSPIPLADTLLAPGIDCACGMTYCQSSRMHTARLKGSRMKAAGVEPSRTKASRMKASSVEPSSMKPSHVDASRTARHYAGDRSRAKGDSGNAGNECPSHQSASRAAPACLSIS